MNVLHGHDSPDTAHLTYAYPFGSNRCVRREWLEGGTLKANVGQKRFVFQTTDRPFNYAYTERIKRDGQAAADAWAHAEIAAGRVRWNAPKAGTYSPLLIMIEKPLEDGSGRLGVGSDGLTGYGDGPERFRAFWDAHGDRLNAAETARFEELKRLSQRINARSWAEAHA